MLLLAPEDAVSAHFYINIPLLLELILRSSTKRKIVQFMYVHTVPHTEHYLEKLQIELKMALQDKKTLSVCASAAARSRRRNGREIKEKRENARTNCNRSLSSSRFASFALQSAARAHGEKNENITKISSEREGVKKKKFMQNMKPGQRTQTVKTAAVE